MRRGTRDLIALSLAAASMCPLHGGADSPSSIVSSDPDTIARGRLLFERNCSPCHGRQGQGENPATPMGGWSADLGPVAPALNGSGHTWHHPPEYLFRIIRLGSTVTRSRMQGWVGRMSDYDILSVIAYFQSLWPPGLRAAYREKYLHGVEDQ